ncbi:MAG: hypothetical protein ACFFA3_03885 [Promethearchaeota archaeon]
MINIPKCKFCGKEVAKNDFVDDFEICINCVMTNTINYSLKYDLRMCLFFLGILFFIVSLFSVITIIPFVLSDFKQYFVFALPPLIMSIISGSLVLSSLLVSKQKYIKERKKPENTLSL